MKLCDSNRSCAITLKVFNIYCPHRYPFILLGVKKLSILSALLKDTNTMTNP